MPNIPNLPGVPALTSYLSAPVLLLAGDILRTLFGPLVSRWGIYLSGIPIIPLGSIITFDYTQNYTISDYPTERGSFQSYNKVQQPSLIKVRAACGGSDLERSIFLALIQAQLSTTETYDVLTPETVYRDYNFTHLSFARSAEKGLGLLTVDIWLQQVRLTATTAFTNTQQPGIAGQQGLGNLQPQPIATSGEVAGNGVGGNPIRLTIRPSDAR